MKKKIATMILAMMMIVSGCGQGNGSNAEDTVTEQTAADPSGVTEVTLSPLAGGNSSTAAEAEDGIDTEDLFTERDLKQEADLSGAEYITVTDGADVTIEGEGVYVLTGQAEEVTISIAADSGDKVQLVLDGLQISNTDRPCIYVKQADKVFVTLLGENALSVNGAFSADGDTNTDAVIFSKDDLVLNGSGALTITSADNGITSRDGIKVTGGELTISCEGSAIEAHEEILIADGTIVVERCNDGLHAENDEDDTAGMVYIGGGTIRITAADDAIHATTIVRIDNGSMTLQAAEAIEGTQIEINGGEISISASDDGINAAQKSSAYTPLFEMNGGTVDIEMGAGDTDGVDSNGDIVINGGTIRISGQSAFDYDNTAVHNGGTILVNGTETDTITNQFGNGFGGPGGMHPEGMDRPDGMEPPEGIRPQGMQHPEGMERPERMEHPEGMERPERMEHPEGTEQSERTGTP